METRKSGEIPNELKAQRRWILWNTGLSPGGRPTKTPDRSTLRPEVWSTWAQVAQVPRTPKSGIGFVFTGGIVLPSGYLIALDLDACRDPQTGALEPWAEDILGHGSLWAEVSPSGGGLHVWFTLPELPQVRGRTRVMRPQAPNVGAKVPEIQVFGLGPALYLCVTGDQP